MKTPGFVCYTWQQEEGPPIVPGPVAVLRLQQAVEAHPLQGRVHRRVDRRRRPHKPTLLARQQTALKFTVSWIFNSILWSQCSAATIGEIWLLFLVLVLSLI